MEEGPRRSGRRRKQTEFFQVGPPDAKKKTIPTTSDHDATKPDEQQQNTVDPVNHIDRLPREILARIFSLLHFRDRLRVEAVSKLWNKVLKKEGWRYFTQCRLSRQLSARRVQTLFSRCGKNLRELVIGPLTAAEAGLHRHSIGPIVDAISRLPRLHTLYIAHRQVHDAQLQRIGQARLGIRCLHLQNCFDMSQDIYTVMELIQEHFPALRHLSLSSCSFRHPAVTHAYIELPDGLRLLELDDSMGPELAHIFWMSTATRLGVGGGHSRPASFPRLLGCSLDFLRPVNDLTYLPKAEALLGRLLYFDISFLKEPSPEVLSSLQQAIPLLTNVRIMCLNRIDGNVLDAVGEHCGQLEHLEYSSHHLCILDAFPQIAHLRCLRVLGIFHHGQAKQPKNAAPKAVVDTFLRLLVNDPAKMGRSSKLEFLSVNFKLPMDLAVQIVRACPALRFLDYQQPPRDLTPLVSAVDQSREEVIKRRGSNNQQQRQQPLFFFLSNSLWESGHNWAKSAWFIPTNEGPEGKMVSVMHEVLARIFEGGPIPELLLRRHTVNYDDE